MVSVMVLGEAPLGVRASAAAVRTLGALVPAAVDGIVRDVQLLANGPDAELAQVAEHAGCGFVEAAGLTAALRAALAHVRTPDVLVLQSGAGFDRALGDEIAAITSRHRRWIAEGLALRCDTEWLVARLLPRFAPVVGVMTTRDRLATVAPTRASALWRALRPRRAFKTRAWIGNDN